MTTRAQLDALLATYNSNTAPTERLVLVQEVLHNNLLQKLSVQDAAPQRGSRPQSRFREEPQKKKGKSGTSNSVATEQNGQGRPGAAPRTNNPGGSGQVPKVIKIELPAQGDEGPVTYVIGPSHGTTYPLDSVRRTLSDRESKALMEEPGFSAWWPPVVWGKSHFPATIILLLTEFANKAGAYHKRLCEEMTDLSLPYSKNVGMRIQNLITRACATVEVENKSLPEIKDAYRALVYAGRLTTLCYVQRRLGDFCQDLRLEMGGDSNQTKIDEMANHVAALWQEFYPIASTTVQGQALAALISRVATVRVADMSVLDPYAYFQIAYKEATVGGQPSMEDPAIVGVKASVEGLSSMKAHIDPVVSAIRFNVRQPNPAAGAVGNG